MAQHLVIDSTSRIYSIWFYFIQLAGAVTAFIYPQGVALGFFDFGTFMIPLLINLELVILINILLNFFVTYKIEGTNTNLREYETDFRRICRRYLYGDFPVDIFIWLPWGFLADIHEGLHFL